MAASDIFDDFTREELLNLSRLSKQAMLDSDDPTMATASSSVPGLSIVKTFRGGFVEFRRALVAAMKERGLLESSPYGDVLPIDFRQRSTSRLESDLTVYPRGYDA